jgi:hypothetical protein
VRKGHVHLRVCETMSFKKKSISHTDDKCMELMLLLYAQRIWNRRHVLDPQTRSTPLGKGG